MNPITSVADLESAVSASFTNPVVIFKHSTRCSISSMALNRLKNGRIDLDFRLIDVLNSKPVSMAVAERFHVHHESPQLLVISSGECVYDASHLEITLEELNEQVMLLEA